MKRIKWLLVIVLGMLIGLVIVTNVTAGDNTAFRKYINNELSIGIDKGSPVSVYDIKKTEVKVGYSIPLILYEFSDSNALLAPYDVSVDGGIVGDLNGIDPILGPGSNVPKVFAQWVIDHSINKVLSNDITIPEIVKIGIVGRADTQRLWNEKELAISPGIEAGVNFKFN